jgi:hypothetical protein
VVTIVREGDSSTGKLSLAERSGVTSTREVVAESCEQVVTALALVAAVCIDQEWAVSEPPETRDAEPPTAARAAKPEPEAPKRLTRSAAAPPPTRSVSTAHRLLARPAARESAERPAPSRFGVGADAALSTAYDELSLVAGIFGELGLAVGPLNDAAVRLSLLHTNNSAAEQDVGAINFAWFLARLDLCPAGLRIGGNVVRLRPCFAAEGGAVSSEGSYEPTGAPPEAVPRKLRPWAAGLGQLRLEVHALGPAWLQAGAGGVVPFTRWTYNFEDAEGQLTTVRQVPIVGGFGSIGVGVHLL